MSLAGGLRSPAQFQDKISLLIKMIEYHKFGFRDSNRGRIKCHGPELEKPHGITHACTKTFLHFFFFLFFKPYSSLVGGYLVFLCF